MLLSDEGPTLEMLDFTIRISNTVHQPFYISICIWTLPTVHNTLLYVYFVTHNTMITSDSFVLRGGVNHEFPYYT